MTCPTLLVQLRARPWIPGLGTPIASSGPALTTRERLSDPTLSAIAIARVWRAGKRWYLLPRPGLSGGIPQALSLRDESSRQRCQTVPHVPAEDGSRS